jgi:hypothetical protein
MSTDNKFLAEIYPTHAIALKRVVQLEDELAACARVLMRIHPIGKVKHIGLLQCSQALLEIEQELVD